MATDTKGQLESKKAPQFITPSSLQPYALRFHAGVQLGPEVLTSLDVSMRPGSSMELLGVGVLINYPLVNKTMKVIIVPYANISYVSVTDGRTEAKE